VSAAVSGVDRLGKFDVDRTHHTQKIGPFGASPFSQQRRQLTAGSTGPASLAMRRSVPSCYRLMELSLSEENTPFFFMERERVPRV
jgi:hypothetical protein